MVSKHEDYELRLAEIVKEARAILEYAEEAIYHFKQDDLKAVSQVLALSHHKVSSYNGCKNDMLAKLAEDGIKPGE